MSAEENLLQEAITSLKQQRDELAVKMHLAEAEASQEFEKAATKLDELTANYDPLKEAVGESAENVGASLQLVADEVKSSFERILKSL
jgi:arabinogalactan endo-1,4-beta-galactosidase